MKRRRLMALAAAKVVIPESGQRHIKLSLHKPRNKSSNFHNAKWISCQKVLSKMSDNFGKSALRDDTLCRGLPEWYIFLLHGGEEENEKKSLLDRWNASEEWRKMHLECSDAVAHRIHYSSADVPHMITESTLAESAPPNIHPKNIEKKKKRAF